ncbi:MAG: glycine cleavage system H protein [candidate division WOR-3 bacterium]
MMNLSDLKFTSTHEWVRVEKGTIVVGITDYIQGLLPRITNVELPEPDENHHYEAGEDVSVIESLRNTYDFKAPVSGIIVEVNYNLLSNPELINEDPYGEGWIIRMKPDNMKDVNKLLDLYTYEDNLPEEEEE